MKLIFLYAFLQSTTALLHPDFLKYISKKYGSTVAALLNRADKGHSGSFGGEPRNFGRKKRPIVFVHGVRSEAGVFGEQRAFFMSHGWTPGRLVATTYGPGVVDFMTGLKETMSCGYAKQVRNMLKATIDYYRSDIGVIAYSMGSPVARKAILGGKCVDTGEDLGRSLQRRIRTFLSVAGANRGSNLCVFPFPGICNTNNGLNCGSAFLKDINSQKVFVAKNLFALASTTDDMLGLYSPCGEKVHTFYGYTEFLKQGVNHVDMIHKTLPEQLALINKGY